MCYFIILGAWYLILEIVIIYLMTWWPRYPLASLPLGPVSSESLRIPVPVPHRAGESTWLYRRAHNYVCLPFSLTMRLLDHLASSHFLILMSSTSTRPWLLLRYCSGYLRGHSLITYWFRGRRGGGKYLHTFTLGLAEGQTHSYIIFSKSIFYIRNREGKWLGRDHISFASVW